MIVLASCASDTKDVESLRTPETAEEPEEVQGPESLSSSEALDLLPPPPTETWSNQAALDVTVERISAYPSPAECPDRPGGPAIRGSLISAVMYSVMTEVLTMWLSLSSSPRATLRISL